MRRINWERIYKRNSGRIDDEYRNKTGEHVTEEIIPLDGLNRFKSKPTSQMIASAAKELHEELFKQFGDSCEKSLIDELLIAAMPALCAEMSLRSRPLLYKHLQI